MMKRVFCIIMALVLLTGIIMADAADNAQFIYMAITKISPEGNLYLNRSAGAIKNAGWKTGDNIKVNFSIPGVGNIVWNFRICEAGHVPDGTNGFCLPKATDKSSVFLTIKGGSLASRLGITKTNRSGCQVRISVKPEPLPSATLPPHTLDAKTQAMHNVIAMLNWLTVSSQRISSSRASRMDLEDLYSELVNDVKPGCVDDTTLDYMNRLQKKIFKFRMLEDQRNQIQYMRDQAEMQAKWKAVASAASEKISSGLDLCVNLAGGFFTWQQAMYDAQMSFAQNKWALNADEQKELDDLRSETFNYMRNIAKEYGLQDNQTLNETSVQEFVRYEAETDDYLRIKYFEPRKDIYALYGGYWLNLARSYYNLGEWQKCLDAIESYRALSIQIFRQDRELASVLPLAINAVSRLSNSDAKFISRAEPYLKLLQQNAPDNEWRMHFSAALILLEFCQRTPDINMDTRRTYFDRAYDEIMLVLPGLIKEQRSQHTRWLVSYNTSQLPPVYEPLRRFIELLHEMQNAAGDSFKDRASELDRLLHSNGEALFVNAYMEGQSWFAGKDTKTYNTTWISAFNGTDRFEIKLPVSQVLGESRLVFALKRYSEDFNDNLYSYNDVGLVTIERSGSDPYDCLAVYESSTLNANLFSRYNNIKLLGLFSYPVINVAWYQSGPILGNNWGAHHHEGYGAHYSNSKDPDQYISAAETRVLLSKLPTGTYTPVRVFKLRKLR